MPVLRPSQLSQGGTPTGIGHRSEPEIDAVSENCSQQGFLVFRRSPIPLMREAAGEPGPAVDIEQDIGDFGAGNQIIGSIPQRFGFGRHGIAQRGDFQLSAGEIDVLELSRRGKRRDLNQLAPQCLPALLEIAAAIGFDLRGQDLRL
jgi:hypothetical protein